jgi:hypothetical protein
MLNWQDIVWDYSSSLTEPDAGYFIKLMAIQWIGAMEVTPFRSKQRSMWTEKAISPKSCSVGSLNKTFQMRGASVPGGRKANQKQQKQPNLIDVHDTNTSKQCFMKMPTSDAQLQLTNEHAKKPWDDRHERGAQSDATAGEVHNRPPGLDSPRQCTVRAVWLVELDPQPNTLKPMNDVLCDQLERCWKRGLSATAVEQHGKHHYYDLRDMCRYNAQTGSRCRIRRMVEEQ